MYSKEGQEAVVKDGYMPLSAKQAAEEVAKVSKLAVASTDEPPPSPSARQMAAASGRIARLRRIDRAAVVVITLGGIAVVAAVLGILVFVASEALPLFRPPR